MAKFTFRVPPLSEWKNTDKPMRVLGIDLGTTNSTVADITWQPGSAENLQVHIIPVEQDAPGGSKTSTLLPSAVAMHGDRVFVGAGARKLRRKAADLDLKEMRDFFFEVKNDMGIKRTYAEAKKGYQSAAEISGHILKTLYDAAMKDTTPVDRVVVTVPASFQGAQRRDTIKAAALAGIELAGGDLLDEPVAAFIDYLIKFGIPDIDKMDDKARLLVLDFGGGTCDVAVFELRWDTTPGQPEISPLTVSRFHRIGGGDIDRAILYEVLLPELCNQNGLDPGDLDFEVKKNEIEPTLIGLAEKLKIKLCEKMEEYRSRGDLDRVNPQRIRARFGSSYTCRVGTRQLILTSPELTLAAFRKILQSFLDTDLLHSKQSEYRLTQSIFAPVQDALERAQLKPIDIDMVLFVGGSALIPDMTAAVKEFFPKAKVLGYQTPEMLQTAVARGAALHAFYRFVQGTPLIPVICPDDLFLRTEGGLMPLAAKGSRLPCSLKAQGKTRLVVPENIVFEDTGLLVEVVAGADKRLIFTQKWELPDQVFPGDALALDWAMDENQCLSLTLGVAGRSDEKPFRCRIENPLTFVVNPSLVRMQVEEIEEQIRNGEIESDDLARMHMRLAQMHAELKQHEKALSLLRKTLQEDSSSGGDALNLMGIYAGQMGDREREEKFYREAIMMCDGSAPLFNLALMLHRQGKEDEALDAISMAVDRSPQGPYFTLRARIHQARKQEDKVAQDLRKVVAHSGELKAMSDWELSWRLDSASMANDEEAAKAAREEQQRRCRSRTDIAPQQGVLPVMETCPA